MQDKWEKRHQREVNRYAAKIEEIYNQAAEEAAAIGHSIYNYNPDRPFSFDHYPQAKEKITGLLKDLANNVEAVIVDGVKSSWTLANNRNSYLTQLLLGEYYNKLTAQQAAQYYTNHHAARDAFLARKANGLRLSDQVWKYTSQFKTEVELGIELGLGDGKSAASMARDLKQYLVEPDRLFRRVRDKYGNLRLSKAAEAFHPGSGVYRSSVRNAQRLTRTENNMSYRLADYLRIQDQDFIVGIEIHLSNNHPVEDICDELKGKYPKTFKFLGWHPHCRCYVTYIVKTVEELNRETAALLEGKELKVRSVNEVKDVPENFKKWVEKNQSRIDAARERGKAAYFIRDNEQYFDFQTKFYKSGGSLSLPIKGTQNKQEYKSNIKAYGELARYHGANYRILPVDNTDGKKNPDALNLDNNLKSDCKTPLTDNGKNAIQNSIKTADKQRANEVLIYLTKDYPVMDIRSGLLASFQDNRATHIKEIVIRFKDGTIKRYEAETLRNIKRKHR